MAATWSVATYEEVYKERYPKGVSTYLAQKSDEIAWFPAETTHGGRPWKIVYRTNAVRGASTIETALADRSAADYDEVEIDYAEEHVVVSVSMKAARRTANDGHSIVRGIEDAVNAMLEELVLTLEHKLFGNGGGARGQIATGGISGSDITVADSSTMYLFARNMKIELSSDDGTTAPGAGVRAGELTIQSVDPSPGNPVLTFTTTVAAGIPGATAGDFIFRKGDYDAGAQRIIQGLRAWSPASTAGLSTAFFGMDRSLDVGALAGTRVVGNGQHITDTMREAAAVNYNNRGRADTIWLNPLKMAEVDQAYAAKEWVTMDTDYAGVKIKGLMVTTQKGPIMFMQTPAMPEAEAVMCRRDAFTLGSIGEVPHVVDDDGQTWRVEALQDAIQQRQRCYPNLGCKNPKHLTHITW